MPKRQEVMSNKGVGKEGIESSICKNRKKKECYSCARRPAIAKYLSPYPNKKDLPICEVCTFESSDDITVIIVGNDVKKSGKTPIQIMYAMLKARKVEKYSNLEPRKRGKCNYCQEEAVLCINPPETGDRKKHSLCVSCSNEKFTDLMHLRGDEPLKKFTIHNVLN